MRELIIAAAQKIHLSQEYQNILVQELINLDKQIWVEKINSLNFIGAEDKVLLIAELAHSAAATDLARKHGQGQTRSAD
jgi:hypothetical protein